MKLVLKSSIIFFDLIDKFIHQRKILNFFKKKQVEINYLIDVGSHKGTYTDLFVKNFNIKKAFLFEPQEKIYKFLRKKYRNNKNIRIFNRAISNKNIVKILRLNHHDLTTTLSKFNKNNLYLKLKSLIFGVKDMTYESIRIKTVKLDQFFKKKTDKIDLLKIDTEGHELEVLFGLNNRINKVKFILIEFHNDKIYEKYDPIKIHNYLLKKNFKLETKFKFPFTTWEDRIYINFNAL